jgi:preprotein translocase subunit Sec61beta
MLLYTASSRVIAALPPLCLLPLKCATLNNELTHSKYYKRLTDLSRKKKDSQGPMPAASAGLLRFFEEETEGIKIRPEILMIVAVALIVVSVLVKIF